MTLKILHTADWHLGKKLEGFSRLDEQQAVLDEIIQIAENEAVHLVIIAGDLFDNYNPGAEAVDLFYRSLKRMSGNGKRAIIAIAGNHDSPERIEAPDPLARECGIIFAGSPHTHIREYKLDNGMAVLRSEPGFIELKLPSIDYPVRILLTPYANTLRLKKDLGIDDPETAMREALEKEWAQLAEKYCDLNGVNLLISHLFFQNSALETAEEPDNEKPILYIGGAQPVFPENIPASIQYSAFGHLHKLQTFNLKGQPAAYSGSPLAYSMSEDNQDKFIILVSLCPGETASLREVKLNSGKRLIKKAFDRIEEAVEWLTSHPDTLVELTIKTTTYLTVKERQQLYAAHSGIVTLIPEVAASLQAENQCLPEVDLKKNIGELFNDYFKYRNNGLEPHESLLEIFKELFSVEEEP